MSELVRIKLNTNEENKAKGFYLLARSGNTWSPAKDEFIVGKKAIILLGKAGIMFEELSLTNK